MDATVTVARREPWNKGKLVGQRAPLKVKDIWAIRVRLQIHGRTRDLALFDLGIDSKLRGCISSSFASAIYSTVIGLARGQLCFSRRRHVRFNGRSRQRPEMRSRHGSSRRHCGRTTISSRTGGVRHRTWAPASTLVSCMVGSQKSISISRVRDALDMTHQADVDLPANEEPQGRSAATWSHKAREHRQVSWHRG